MIAVFERVLNLRKLGLSVEFKSTTDGFTEIVYGLSDGDTARGLSLSASEMHKWLNQIIARDAEELNHTIVAQTKRLRDLTA